MQYKEWLDNQKQLLGRNLRAVGIFFIFYIVFGLWLTWQQESLIYQPPTTQLAECPALAGATLVTIGTTRLYVKGHDERLIILYHGNAGSICDRVHYVEQIREAGWGYILVGYSGYGDGTGKPTHSSIQSDIKNVILYLDEVKTKEVYIIGESLGAGIASQHARQKPPAALLLVTPFDTLRNLAQFHYWYFPTTWLVREAYDSVSALSAYQGRVVILHGDTDQIVPLHLAKQLYASLNTDDKQIEIVIESGHNDLWFHPKAHSILREFLRHE